MKICNSRGDLGAGTASDKTWCDAARITTEFAACAKAGQSSCPMDTARGWRPASGVLQVGIHIWTVCM